MNKEYRIRAALGATDYAKKSHRAWQELFIAAALARRAGPATSPGYSKDKRTRVLTAIARDAPEAAPGTLEYVIRFADRVLTACTMFRMLEVRYQEDSKQGAAMGPTDYSAASQRAAEWCRCVFAAELSALGLYGAGHATAQSVNIYDEYDVFRIGMAHQSKQWADYLFVFLHDIDSMHGGVFVKNYLPVVLNDFFAAVSRGVAWRGVADGTGVTAQAIDRWLRTHGTFITREEVAQVSSDVPMELSQILDLSVLREPGSTALPSEPPADPADERGDPDAW